MLSETDELHCDALSGLGWDGNSGGFPNNTHVSISWGNITYALYCTIYSVSFDNLIPCHILISGTIKNRENSKAITLTLKRQDMWSSISKLLVNFCEKKREE